jgi:hypothetical protein
MQHPKRDRNGLFIGEHDEPAQERHDAVEQGRSILRLARPLIAAKQSLHDPGTRKWCGISSQQAWCELPSLPSGRPEQPLRPPKVVPTHMPGHHQPRFAEAKIPSMPSDDFEEFRPRRLSAQEWSPRVPPFDAVSRLYSLAKH